MFVYLLKVTDKAVTSTIELFSSGLVGHMIEHSFAHKVHYVSVCTSFLHAGGFSYCPMQNFYIAKHSTGLLVVNTGCNTKMIETCEK